MDHGIHIMLYNILNDIYKVCNKIFSIGKKFNIVYYAAPPHHRITPETYFYSIHTSRPYENDFIEGRCRFFL